MYVSSQLGRYLRIPKDTAETREVRQAECRLAEISGSAQPHPQFRSVSEQISS